MPLNLLDESLTNDISHVTRQLIVVGNGLDLYCGLASRFADFFATRRDKLRSLEHKALKNAPGWQDYLIGNGLTAWDIVLEQSASDQNESKNWSDIETAIADWIVPRKAGEDGRYIVQNRHLRRVLAFLNGVRTEYRAQNRFSEGEVAHFLMYVYRSDSWDHSLLLDKLMVELHKLEKEFSEYLLDKVESTEGYSERHSKVFHGVVFDELEGKKRCSLEHSILNFNYTIPGWFFRDEDFDLVDHYVNIHGDLHHETVIGIDATGHMDDPGVAQFTKTYRVMGMGSSAVKGIVHSGQGTDSGPRTALMKFIGHSLNEADYSYFQSLFDTVDLYGGETRLVFYYVPHGGSDFASACNHSKKGVMSGVVRLLTKYGETLDNADHGRNLIHKLLLEGRLAVKLVPGAEDMWQLA